MHIRIAALLLVWPSIAVDRSKFRTCEQGAFCRRYRGYVQRVQDSGDHVHVLDPASLVHAGNEVQALIEHRYGGAQPLQLRLSFFRAAETDGACGVLRTTLSERPEVQGSSSSGLASRFRVREGDVVMVPDSGLQHDAVTVRPWPDSNSGSLISSSSPGNCSVALRYAPLEIDIFGGGRLLQSLNARHLLNFEQSRRKDAGQRKGGKGGLVDATDVEAKDLWEEAFGEHNDSKPRGPQAVGIDCSFREAPVLVGLAEHATRLHLASPGFEEPYRLFNLDVFEYEVDVPMAIYGNIPMVTAVHQWPDGQATASGLLVVNPSEGFVKVDTPKNSSDSQTWWLFEAGVLDIFSFMGPTPETVLRQYHAVTGWPRMPPLAALGKHQSRWNYVDAEDVATVDRGFDEHEIPYDFIWLDLEHTDAKRYFTWDPKHFPPDQVDGMLDRLNRSHRKLVTIIDPHLFASDNKYSVAVGFKEKGLLVKKPSGDGEYEGFCWPGPSHYPDFCDPRMRAEWAKLFDFANYPGRRAEIYTWNDMNEPSVFDGPEISMPRDALHRCHGDAFDVEHREVHNLYGFYVHAASVEGHLLRDPNIRPFVLTRAFFAGSHRHGPAWTGDNMASWVHLERSVPMLLSLAMCGMSLVGADVGGFMGDPDTDLLVRWHQLGIWYPFYRAHAHLTTKRREPWLFGAKVTDKIRQAVLTRYQLLPMWYTLAAEWALLGSPMIRPVWYHDLADTQAYQHADSHFFVGEALLVRAPAEGVKTVKVYLPGKAAEDGSGGSFWYDFWRPAEKKLRRGGEKAFDLKVQSDRLPVFARAGHILAQRWRPRRSSGAMMADPHTLVCYFHPQSIQAHGKVYLDDGRSHDFTKGLFVYDEFRFDGAILQGEPMHREAGRGAVAAGWDVVAAPARKSFAGTQLPAVLQEGLRVERVVFVGLAKAPIGAQRHGSGREVGLSAEKMEGGELWMATLKDPGIYLGTKWTLELLY